MALPYGISCYTTKAGQVWACLPVGYSDLLPLVLFEILGILPDSQENKTAKFAHPYRVRSRSSRIRYRPR
jgi:hypothetical protein